MVQRFGLEESKRRKARNVEDRVEGGQGDKGVEF